MRSRDIAVVSGGMRPKRETHATKGDAELILGSHITKPKVNNPIKGFSQTSELGPSNKISTMFQCTALGDVGLAHFCLTKRVMSAPSRTAFDASVALVLHT